jgi:adenine phosphoribosyltransferase
MTPEDGVNLRSFVRDIPDFPEPGIVFKDITPLLLDPVALGAAVARLTRFARDMDIDYVLAAEARGFILGGALANSLHAGFVPARKRGKLPLETVRADYALEYGIDALEMHADAFANLLATGGTARALADLVQRLGGEIVACAFLGELQSLGGRERLEPHLVHALIELD